MTTPSARKVGTLVRWNADRGFGFIAADGGGADVFVHASDMSRIGGAPEVGWRLDFQVRTAKDGKTRAFDVQREGMRLVREPRMTAPPAVPRAPAPARPARGRPSSRRASVYALMILVVGAAALHSRQREQQTQPEAQPLVLAAPAASGEQQPAFNCDGRTSCSQMRSCAEATYFIQHCPNTEMDGDGDGEPCEQQWCN